MKGRIVAVALVLVVVLGVGIGYYVGSNQRVTNSTARSTSTTTTLSATPSATSTAQTGSTQGVRLIASVSPSRIPRGQNVTIGTQVYNQGPTSLTLNASEIIDPFEGPCGLGIRSAGFDIYLGYFTAGNLSAAPTPLMLYNASSIPVCSAVFTYTYIFHPDSSDARVEYLSSFTNVSAEYTSSIEGYWVNCCVAGPGPSFTFLRFPSGTYTVVVFDAWGDQAVEHFVVS